MKSPVRRAGRLRWVLASLLGGVGAQVAADHAHAEKAPLAVSGGTTRPASSASVPTGGDGLPAAFPFAAARRSPDDAMPMGDPASLLGLLLCVMVGGGAAAMRRGRR